MFRFLRAIAVGAVAGTLTFVVVALLILQVHMWDVLTLWWTLGIAVAAGLAGGGAAVLTQAKKPAGDVGGLPKILKDLAGGLPPHSRGAIASGTMFLVVVTAMNPVMIKTTWDQWGLVAFVGVISLCLLLVVVVFFVIGRSGLHPDMLHLKMKPEDFEIAVRKSLVELGKGFDLGGTLATGRSLSKKDFKDFTKHFGGTTAKTCHLFLIHGIRNLKPEELAKELGLSEKAAVEQIIQLSRR